MFLLALTACVAGCGKRKSLRPEGDGGPATPDAGSTRDVMPDAGSGPDAFERRDALPEVADPGGAALRRLSDTEYANTVQDLFGLSGFEGALVASVASPESAFEGFDNLAGVNGVPPQRLERYFATAVFAAETALADPQARARLLVCSPAADEAPCIRSIVERFGRRAWRRPLAADELDGLAALVSQARAAGDDFATAVRQAVIAMLVSESFLFRIELEPADADAQPRPLTGYELASRLSYLLWSTMPDDHLFGLAAAGGLADPAALTAEVTRMLADPRAGGFERDFLGQWLGFRELYGPRLSRPASAEWSAELQASMAEEARLFVDELLKENANLSELLTRQVHFIDWRLSQLYDYNLLGTGEALVRTVPKVDKRGGYLGLAAPLTLTSYSTRSTPTIRGIWVLDRFLCLTVPDAPPDIHWAPVPPGDTPREVADAIGKMPLCGPCHRLSDRVGLALEHFDQIGAYRERYADPPASVQLIDQNGVLPPDVPFYGVVGLEDALAADPRFYQCAVRKALTYAVGRPFGKTEDARVEAIEAAWKQGGHTLRGLMAAIVVDDSFRYRRREAE